MNYEKDVEDDAEALIFDNEDMFKEAIKDENDFDRNDIGGLDSLFHETIVDRSYTPSDAGIIMESCENPESDSGLWEGQEPTQAMCSMAAWSYANDVWFKAEELYKELQGEYNEKIGALTEDEQIDRSDDIINSIFEETKKQSEIEPVEEGSKEELRILKEWMELNKKAGMWGGYPLGSSYIDARCGSGHGMPDIKDFVDFDHEVRSKLPHMSGKYKGVIEEKIAELETKYKVEKICPHCSNKI